LKGGKGIKKKRKRKREMKFQKQWGEGQGSQGVLGKVISNWPSHKECLWKEKNDLNPVVRGKEEKSRAGGGGGVES